MKKFFALFTVVLMIVAMTVTASAEATYLADQEIPYATTAPTLDGVMSEGEWTAKFSLPVSKMLVLAGEADTSNQIQFDTYMAWDESYLYIAANVSDTNGGLLYYGADGDNIIWFLDVNGIGAANGNTPSHALNVACFPVVTTPGSSEPTGFHTRLNGAEFESSQNILVQPNSACSGSNNSWTIEIRLTWDQIGSLLGTAYAGQTLPAIAPGVVITFTPFFHDCNAQNAGLTNYVGQLTGAGDPASVTPANFGFRGTLAAAPAPETPDAPATADALSFGILLGAVALAGTTLVIGKKKAN